MPKIWDAAYLKNGQSKGGRNPYSLKIVDNKQFTKDITVQTRAQCSNTE